MKDYKLNISAVLEKELTTMPPLIPVIVAKIQGEKSDIPRVFQLIRKMLTPNLKHLRRVRILPNDEYECILCKSSDDEGEQKDQLKKLETQFACEKIFKDYRIDQVPSKAPVTDLQLKAIAGLWPSRYAKSNYLNQCINGSLLIETEKLVLRLIVNSVANYLRLVKNKYKAAAVVFRGAKVYGVGMTCSEAINHNPLQHSTMMSLDSVATEAGSGHWRCKASDHLLKTIQTKLDEREELKEFQVDSNFSPYLCTNYDIFITEEPCFMCTMGLVQSRIRRLFYLDNESLAKLANCQRLCYQDGAIEEFTLHREKNLNHRFEAWRVTIESEEDDVNHQKEVNETAEVNAN